ncbi:MAG: amphi-Trp domain-containing protein [Pseudodesulfovibrio sp.]|nr:amphi-Trp domain-containing protein [Pseudodesulfovibrio sp.]
MGKSKVCVKQTLSRTGTIVFLKEILKGLESGSVVVGEGDDSMEFSVTDQIEVELKGKVKRDRDRVSFSLSWPRGAAVPAERQEARVPAKTEV